MSFILDALKKSETDRQRQTSPALFEVKVAAPRSRFPTWAVGLAVLLGVNVIVLAWLLLRQPATPDAAPSPAPVAAAPEASAPAPQVATESRAGATMTLPATVTVTIPSSGGVSVAQEQPQSGVVAPSFEPPLEEEPYLSAQEPVVPPDYDERDYRPAITPAQAGATAANRTSVPTRDEVLARGTQLPELRLDLHVYDDDPASRFVFINMRKLREGDSLPEGVRVDSITPRGARLSFRGTTFNLEGN
jgi:general secretion pathway protein B